MNEDNLQGIFVDNSAEDDVAVLGLENVKDEEVIDDDDIREEKEQGSYLKELQELNKDNDESNSEADSKKGIEEEMDLEMQLRSDKSEDQEQSDECKDNQEDVDIKENCE